MWLFDQQGFADAKSIGNLLYPWFGSFLGMASACVVYGFALIFLFFQLRFFFLIFFLELLYGALQCLQNIFLEEGEMLYYHKKHHIKETLVKESARFSSIFIENRDSLCFSYIFIGLGLCQSRKIKFSLDVVV